MKARFQGAWANLGQKAPPLPLSPPKRVIRILDLPGFQALEDKRVVTQPARGPLTADFEASVDALSESTFGITKAQTEYEPPYEYWEMSEDDPAKWAIGHAWDEHDKKFASSDLPYDERVAYLKDLGWDFTDQRGNLLQITELFCRQVEAVSKGLGGRMPDTASIGLESWATQVEREAREFKKNARRKGNGGTQ